MFINDRLMARLNSQNGQKVYKMSVYRHSHIAQTTIDDIFIARHFGKITHLGAGQVTHPIKGTDILCSASH